MRKHLALLDAAADNALRLRARSLTVLACLVALLTPFLAAVAVSQGLREQAAASVRDGADLYVAGNRFGQNGPLPVAFAERVRTLDGVTEVVPRIVGRDTIVGPVVVVGLPPDRLARLDAIASGRVPGAAGEVLVGHGLARASGLRAGVEFTFRSDSGRAFLVVGVLGEEAPVWGAEAVFLPFADAASLYRSPGQATDLLVYTAPGRTGAVAEAIGALSGTREAEGLLLRVVSRDLVRELYERGYGRRAGVFVILYLVAFSLGIPCLAVVSGLGAGERRREVGLLRAAGWETGEVLEMVFLENLLLAVAGAALSALLALLWIRVANGFFLAQVLVSEAGLRPPFPLPARFGFEPLVLGFLLALALTSAGTLYQAWRVATASPLEAIR